MQNNQTLPATIVINGQTYTSHHTPPDLLATKKLEELTGEIICFYRFLTRAIEDIRSNIQSFENDNLRINQVELEGFLRGHISILDDFESSFRKIINSEDKD